jgi:hypothetical protein
MCQYIDTKVGATGLTVTVDVDTFNPATKARVALVTGGSATEARNGRYYYWIDDYDESLLYTADFMTADTDVDQRYLAAFMWDGAAFHRTELAHLDADITSRAAASILTGITSLAGWLRGLARKSTMDATAKSELNSGGGTYDEATDSLEANRDNIGTAGAGLTGLADPLDNAVPGDYAAGTGGYALGRLGRGELSVTSPVLANGDVETYQGATYNNTYGTALEWTDDDNAWPTLTDAVILVLVNGNSFSGSVVTPTGDGKTVRLELTATHSAAIDEGGHDFQVWAEWSSPAHKHPLVVGTWTSIVRLPAA